MPWYNLKKVWTPLEIVGIRIYRELEEGSYWYQVGKGRKRRFRKGAEG